MDWFDTEGMDATVVGLVSGGHFLSHFYILAFPPLFPFLRQEFALSNVELGLIVSVIQAGTFLQVFAGDVVDRVGGKRVFVLGLVVTAAGTGLASTAGSYPVLLAFALVSGVGQAAFHPADYALLDAASDERTEGRSFGLHNFAGFAGFAAGPAVVGGVALAASWQLALAVAGALGLAYAVVAHVLMEDVYLAGLSDRDDREAGDGVGRRDPTILALFVFFVVISVGTIGVQSFTPVLVVDGFALSEAVGSTTLTAYFALSAVGILAGGALADRFQPHTVIVATLLGAAALTWTVAAGVVPARAAAVVAAFAVLGVVLGLLFPARDRLVNAASASGSTGRSFGFVFTGISVAGIAGPALLGWVIDVADVWTGFWLIGVSFVAAAGIAAAIGTGRVGRAAAAVGDG